jgi:hypothetical protein
MTGSRIGKTPDWPFDVSGPGRRSSTPSAAFWLRRRAGGAGLTPLIGECITAFNCGS